MWRMWCIFGITALVVPAAIASFLDMYVPASIGMPLLLVSFWGSLIMAALVVVQRRKRVSSRLLQLRALAGSSY